MRRLTIEEYLEKIYELQERDGTATTGNLAEEMNIKPPSVTQMLQKLSDEGLVKYNPYQGATLTSKGLVKAQELMKKHEILSDFLIMLGIEPKIAEEDACRMEHQISPHTLTHLHSFMEYLKNSPDGQRWIEKYMESLSDNDEK